MQASAVILPILAQFLGGWEIVLILAVVLILFGARKLPQIGRGFSDGISHFRNDLDNEATEAGESLGGICGKQAVEALTPDNQIAELYDPAVFRNQKASDSPGKETRSGIWPRLWRTILRLVFRRFV